MKYFFSLDCFCFVFFLRNFKISEVPDSRELRKVRWSWKKSVASFQFSDKPENLEIVYIFRSAVKTFQFSNINSSNCILWNCIIIKIKNTHISPLLMMRKMSLGSSPTPPRVLQHTGRLHQPTYQICLSIL